MGKGFFLLIGGGPGSSICRVYRGLKSGHIVTGKTAVPLLRRLSRCL